MLVFFWTEFPKQMFYCPLKPLLNLRCYMFSISPSSSLTRPEDITVENLFYSRVTPPNLDQLFFFKSYYNQSFHPKDKRDKWDQRENVKERLIISFMLYLCKFIIIPFNQTDLQDNPQKHTQTERMITVASVFC